MQTVGVAEPVRVFPGQLTCADAPVWMLSDDEIDDDLATLDRDEARLAARRAELLVEARRRGLAQIRTRSLSPERWLRDSHRWSTRRATAALKQAERVVARPQVHDALAAGAASVEQVETIGRVLDAVDLVPDVDEQDRQAATAFLLGECGSLDPAGLARAGQQLVEALSIRPSVDDPADAAAVERENRAAERAAQLAEHNQLHVRRRPDGSITGKFRIAPADAAVMEAWLRQADTKHPGEGEFADTRDPAVRRGDHLVATVAHACRSGIGHTRPVQARVVVTIPFDALRDGVANAGMLATGGALSAAETRRLACAAGIVPAVLGGESQVLDVGRSRQHFTWAQKAAMAIRDGGCIGLGCDCPPAACDAHHVHEWEGGGTTDVDNGVLACPFHHKVIHRQGWKVVLAANGRPALIPPSSIDPQRRPRQHHRFALIDATRRRRT